MKVKKNIFGYEVADLLIKVSSKEEYYKLMADKKKLSSKYYEARATMQEILKAQKNVEMFLDEEQKREEKERQKEQDR